MSKIRYRGVEKRFDSVTALHALDLDVPDGEFVALLGPSGCGKTTALRILAGLELPTAGSVWIGDREVTRAQPRDRDVAMVFQSYALYPHMTVGENIGYPLRIRKISGADRDAAVRRVAEVLEVSHLLDRRPRALSGGQRQRVALARAIVREPAAFLMDEPLSNLDARLRLAMRGEIKRLQKRLGTTTLYVTHDQAEAMTMADNVAVMRDGVLQQLAPPNELYDRPVNRFVATFVGSPATNALACVLDENARELVLGCGRVPAPEGATPVVSACGVRPEDMSLVSAGEAGALQGEVWVVEPMGNETLVDVRLGDERATVRAPRGFDAPIGSPIGVAFDPRSACLFDSGGMTVAHRSDQLRNARRGASG